MKSKTIQLSKNFRFESAHRLAHGYQGKCKNIHGHSWNGKIAVVCTQVDSMGMAMDYGIIKEFCKELEDKFDHKLLLSKDDPTLPLLSKELEESIVVMENNPTSENLGIYIHARATEYFFVLYNRGLIQELPLEVIITIDETCTSSCTIK